MPDPAYTAFIREYVTKNGWRSAGQTGYFRHQESGAYFDAFAVARDADGTLRPVWKVLAARDEGPEVVNTEEERHA